MRWLPALWRNKNYMLLWSGQVVSTVGSSASQIIYPLLILALTDSPAAAGIAASMRALPYLLFSLPVGALVDRRDRKRVMIWSDIGRVLAVASIPVALAFDALSLPQLYAVSFIEGALFVFFNIAEVTALSRVVPAVQLPQAAAQNEAAFGAAGIIGPSFGTILFQTLGRSAPFIAYAVSFAVSAISVVLIKADFGKAAPPPSRGLLHEIGEGLRWMWQMPLIRTMAFLTGGLNMVNAAAPLILIVIARNLGASAAEIGLIFRRWRDAESPCAQRTPVRRNHDLDLIVRTVRLTARASHADSRVLHRANRRNGAGARPALLRMLDAAATWDSAA